MYLQGQGRQVLTKTTVFGKEEVLKRTSDRIIAVRVSGIKEIKPGTPADPEKGTPATDDSLTIQFMQGGKVKSITAFGSEQIAKVQALKLQEGDFINADVIPAYPVFVRKIEGTTESVAFAASVSRLVEIEKGSAPAPVK